MNEQQLRKWLGDKLGRKVPDSTWEVLKFRQHLDDIETNEADLQELLKVAPLLLPYSDYMEGVIPPLKKSSTKKSSNTTSRDEELPARPLKLDGVIADRGEALGEYLALRAAALEPVREFRRQVLCGKLLSKEEATAFVKSDAARRFSLEWFREYSVPIVRHVSRFYQPFMAYASDEEDGGVEISVDPFDDREGVDFYEGMTIFVDPPGEVFDVLKPKNTSHEDLDRLEVFSSTISATRIEDNFETIAVYPGSPLDNLRRISKWLVEHLCHSWREAQAVQFILTGEPTAPMALTAEIEDLTGNGLVYGVVTLKVQPWVPSGTVTKVYQDLQHQMLQGKPHAPSLKNLTVFRFVMRELRSNLSSAEGKEGKAPKRPPWRVLMKRWNEAHPGWAYKDESVFSRDFDRASRAVVYSFPSHYMVETTPLYWDRSVPAMEDLMDSM